MLTLTATATAFSTRLLDHTPATVTATVEDKDGYTVITPATRKDADIIVDTVENMYNRYWISGQDRNGYLHYAVPTPSGDVWGVSVKWL